MRISCLAGFVVSAVAAFTLTVQAAEDALFPFVVSYDAPNNVTNISSWLSSPAGKQGFVRADGDRFVTDAGTIRFWGVNFAFEANFPSHEKAERVAARLARFGINVVRLHHMDSHNIWGKSKNKLTIDPVQLEKLDYLIYQLKQHGIYVNINLHVSRWLGAAEGFSGQDQRPNYDKGLDYFEPRMIEAQKKYARDLLTHVNPYTKTAYTDEPAVAFVEISNEDSLFSEWNGGQLDNLPEPYATTYRKLWNFWLRKKYGSTDAIRKAWGAGSSVELGEEMLKNGDFTKPLSQPWYVERDDRTRADVKITSADGGDSGHALRIAVNDPGRIAWHPQLVQSGITVKSGQTYTLTFRIRADNAKQCYVNCLMAHDPWQQLGLGATVKTSPKWKNVRLTFMASADDAKARITFTQFQQGGTYELADVSLRPGGVVGLTANDRLEDDSIPTVRPGSHSPAGSDFCDFLCDVERHYWYGMQRFLKEDLHVRSLICGTQLGYSTENIQAGLDYIDHHAYWKHPAFPHRPWDGNDWYVEDAAMVNSAGGTLLGLASGRVANRAFTVTEYNHPAPLSYAAEGFPMVASFGAFQNWSAIYVFAYSHNADFEPTRITSFFDMKSRTDQLVHTPACVAMFVRGDVTPSTQPAVFRFTRKDETERLHHSQNTWSLTAKELADDLRYCLLHGVSLDVAADAADAPKHLDSTGGEGRKAFEAGRFVSDTGQLCWDVSEKNAGYFTVNAPRSKMFTGFVHGRTFTLGDVALKISQTQLDWATITMTAIDGKGFDQPGRILIAATGVVQNQGAKLEKLGGDRVTLRTHWGQGPVLCEGIDATVTLPAAKDRVQCYPLDESGNRREAIAVGQAGDHAQIELSSKHKTIWYEIEIKP